MVITNSLVVFYTNICNIACEHCYLKQMINIKKCHMSSELLKYLIDYSEGINIEQIILTGGEPILFIDEIKDCLSFRNRKIKLSIYTNCYWGENYESRRDMISKLLDVGVDRLEISTDIYHQKYISLNETIIPTVKMLNEYGIKVLITICFENIYEIYETYRQLIRVVSSNQIICRRVSSLDTKFKRQSIENIKTGICDSINDVLVNYFGDVYGCCGPCILSKDNPLYLGNLSEITMDEIMSKRKNNLFIENLQKNCLGNICNNINIDELYHKGLINNICDLCFIYFEQRR